MPASTHVPLVRLTSREIEVLTAIAEGNTSAEVAETLFLSKRTVDFHLANVYQKLDVDNRLKAIKKAKALKLIGTSH